MAGSVLSSGSLPWSCGRATSSAHLVWDWDGDVGGGTVEYPEPHSQPMGRPVHYFLLSYFSCKNSIKNVPIHIAVMFMSVVFLKCPMTEEQFKVSTPSAHAIYVFFSSSLFFLLTNWPRCVNFVAVQFSLSLFFFSLSLFFFSLFLSFFFLSFSLFFFLSFSLFFSLFFFSLSPSFIHSFFALLEECKVIFLCIWYRRIRLLISPVSMCVCVSVCVRACVLVESCDNGRKKGHFDPRLSTNPPCDPCVSRS